MPAEDRTDDLVDHYSRGDLLDAIAAGVEAIGKTTDTVTVDDLAPVDEFHIGGRVASEDFISQLSIDAAHHVLDVGCGLGGTSRFIANSTGCRVTGIDLTQEFVDTGVAMCSWVGLDDHVTLVQGSALAMDFEEESFEHAVMLHVGMNIEDKAALCADVFRVLKPGGIFGVFDVMKTGDVDITFPVPWSTAPETSHVDTPETYKTELTGAGFTIEAERNRRDFAADFFAKMKAHNEARGGPPPLGLHITFGTDAPLKVKNMVENIAAGGLAPCEIIARKPA